MPRLTHNSTPVATTNLSSISDWHSTLFLSRVCRPAPGTRPPFCQLLTVPTPIPPSPFFFLPQSYQIFLIVLTLPPIDTAPPYHQPIITSSSLHLAGALLSHALPPLPSCVFRYTLAHPVLSLRVLGSLNSPLCSRTVYPPPAPNLTPPHTLNSYIHLTQHTSYINPPSFYLHQPRLAPAPTRAFSDFSEPHNTSASNGGLRHLLCNNQLSSYKVGGYLRIFLQ